MDLATALAQIRAMNMDDRIRLVEAIWDEIASDSASAALTEAQKEELDRRLADDDAHPDDGVPWDVIRAEARSRRR